VLNFTNVSLSGETNSGNKYYTINTFKDHAKEFYTITFPIKKALLFGNLSKRFIPHLSQI
jgi:hypothetical protein